MDGNKVLITEEEYAEYCAFKNIGTVEEFASFRKKRTCEYCGEDFILKHGHEKYCDKCKLEAKTKRMMELRHTDELVNLLRNIRQKLDNCKMPERKEFLNAEVRRWRIEIKAGEKTKEQLIKWLKQNFYSRKKWINND